MAEVVLFHHAQGLTAGCLAFADELRAAGHVVHTPDLYEGKTFAKLDEGIAYAKQTGFGVVNERALSAAKRLPAEVVYAGFSLGVMAAQELAQTRPGAKGAVLMHAAIPLEEFGGSWPEGVPLQIHTMEGDDLGDAEVARELKQQVKGAEVLIYPGDKHLFTDSSLDAYDESAARLVMQRVLGFLGEVR